MNKRRKYTLNETYFDIIDTENKAYILGFLYADGYNNEKSGQIKLCLQQQDVSVLEFIKTEVGSNIPIKNESGYFALTLNSRYMSNQLSLLGCHQAKTFTLLFPSIQIVPLELQRHFIRGYFDGDGCIFNKVNENSSIVSFVGNINFINSLNDLLSVELDIDKVRIIAHPKSKNVHYLKYYHNKIISKLQSLLYEESYFYLERKYNKFFFYKKKIKKSKYDEKQVYDLYQELKSTYKVGQQLGTSNVTIGKILNKYYPHVLSKTKINDNNYISVHT